MLMVEADEEHMLWVQIEGKRVPMLVDTGTTHTCESKTYHAPPHVEQICWDSRIFGTEAVNLNEGSSENNHRNENAEILIPILFSKQTHVNLMRCIVWTKCDNLVFVNK